MGWKGVWVYAYHDRDDCMNSSYHVVNGEDHPPSSSSKEKNAKPNQTKPNQTKKQKREKKSMYHGLLFLHSFVHSFIFYLFYFILLILRM